MQFSFDIKRALGSGWVVEAGYRATRGVHPQLQLQHQSTGYGLSRLPNGPRSQQRSENHLVSAFSYSLRPFPALNSIALFENAAN